MSSTLMGSFLKEERTRVGLSQEELSARYDAPQSFVSKLETGERTLRFYEVFYYSEALGMEVETFYVHMKTFLAKYKNKKEGDFEAENPPPPAKPPCPFPLNPA